ncbi:Protein disulfide isomerase-like 5-1 [Camellia lanceoleosa]|uniref:Protein disulfide isomerase-like 5-1 n=1 Tax=Camellia lanceoleosa TaxID=1840588 RepID=A0ACC0IMZ6_9ERIC|nr:Protein disulfide isomerase-like 5-1 [Camellia lanceoleosa]
MSSPLVLPPVSTTAAATPLPSPPSLSSPILFTDLHRHPSPLMLIPALRTVGNIVTGDDMQTQPIMAVVDPSSSWEILVRGPEGFTLWTGPPYNNGRPSIKNERVPCTSEKFSEDGSKLRIIKSNSIISIHDLQKLQRDQVNHFGPFVRFFYGLPAPTDSILARMVLTTLDSAVYWATSLPYEDEIEFGRVDCGIDKPVCNKVDIHSYPTFKLFYNGEEVAKYQGPRDVEFDPQWAGICNGMAAGVMLAASFDLIQEGQEHGSGIWVELVT